MNERFFIAQDDILKALLDIESEAGRLADEFEARIEALLDKVTNLIRDVKGLRADEDLVEDE